MSDGDRFDRFGKAYDARLIARLWPFVRPHWAVLALSMLLIPVIVGLELALPYLIKVAIDVNVALHTTAGLDTLVLLFLGAVVLSGLAQCAHQYTLQLVGQRAGHQLREVGYSHVISRRAAFYDRTPVGQLLSRITNDVESINEMFSGGVVTAIADAARLLGIAIAMLALDSRLALLTFLSIPLLVALVAVIRPLMRRSFRAIRASLAAMNAYMAEHLNGLAVVQLFVRQERAARGYLELSARYRDAYLESIKADSVLFAMGEAIAVGGAAAIAWYAGANIGKTGLTVGLVAAFIEYANRFFVPIRDFSAKYTVMQSAMAATERVMALLDTQEPDAPVSAPAAVDASAADPAIELRDVEFSYRSTEPVLCGVDLVVPRGSTVALVGATGSGKSTLIRLIARFYEPDSGTIAINGRQIATWPAHELRLLMSVVSQDVFLFAGTVADNVRLGKLDATDAEIERALARVGADVVLARRGATPSEVVAEHGSNFSVGERQLISFARALVRDPEILILDEATAHVDPETESAIERGARALMAGRTTLVIAHRLSTIRDADRIVVMASGRIVEAGTRDELLALDGAYGRLERLFQSH